MLLLIIFTNILEQNKIAINANFYIFLLLFYTNLLPENLL